jgi:hypothetical protein
MPCDKRPALRAWFSLRRLLVTGRAGKLALALLILNEIRGLVVVAIVVKAWLRT